MINSGNKLVKNPFRQYCLPLLLFLFLICQGSAAWSETVTWNVDADGEWHQGSNWSTGLAPGSGDDVVIDRAAGVYTITVSSGVQYANSIACMENLVITGGSLTVASTVQVSGQFAMEGGVLIDAVVQTALEYSGVSGKLDGVTIEGDFIIGEDSNASMEILNDLTLNG
ncbi:MAG: hypothetical protein KAH56_03955, partial [Candidatus Krumholzibacteria bacterium]|nr:hypothetical protein [Candidatus Krumholzibacteria bacterium]